MFCCGAETSPPGRLDQTYQRHSGSIHLEDKRGDYLKHKTFLILHSVGTFGSSEGSSLCSVLFFVFLILCTISHGVVNIWSRTGSVVRIFRAVKAVCWALRRPFVLFTLLSVLALYQVSRRKCQQTWLSSSCLCLSLQAAEWDEPTDLFRQRQWQRQGQRCRWQQDWDQPGHASVPHGMDWCPHVPFEAQAEL